MKIDDYLVGDDVYQNLAFAIIAQATEDCNILIQFSDSNGNLPEWVKEENEEIGDIFEIKDFFYSKWFEVLSEGLDGKDIFNRLIENHSDQKWRRSFIKNLVFGDKQKTDPIDEPIVNSSHGFNVYLNLAKAIIMQSIIDYEIARNYITIDRIHPIAMMDEIEHFLKTSWYRMLSQNTNISGEELIYKIQRTRLGCEKIFHHGLRDGKLTRATVYPKDLGISIHTVVHLSQSIKHMIVEVTEKKAT